jgi:hypothetical protein
MTNEKMLERIIGEHIRLQWRCDAGLPPIFADPGMLEQVILNLAVNARDAMPEGGQLTLSVEAVTLTETAAEQHPKARPGRFICLSVADTGCGIEPENLARIFEPFFTTKEVGKGTGLGLATVYGIVEQHQGWVDVATQVGRGSVFKIFLPITVAEPVAPPPPALPPPRRGQGEMVLLVEDELAVREFAERVLRIYELVAGGRDAAARLVRRVGGGDDPDRLPAARRDADGEQPGEEEKEGPGSPRDGLSNHREHSRRRTSAPRSYP